MIDIHSHILPGLDDGARDNEEALAMVRMAAEAGTTDIVATPHSNWQFAFDPELVREKIEELQNRCGYILRIHYGCDLHLSVGNIETALADPQRYSINRNGYVLVEFSDLQIPNSSSEILARLIAGGMIPIITHPERNPILQKGMKALKSWVEDGCLIQITAQSLFGHFGSRAESASKDLMHRELVHFIASDGHDLDDRPPVLSRAWDWVVRKYGAERAEALFVTNPGAVLSGAKLPGETAGQD
jgi:protein-tyrosine phosphatase